MQTKPLQSASFKPGVLSSRVPPFGGVKPTSSKSLLFNSSRPQTICNVAAGNGKVPDAKPPAPAVRVITEDAISRKFRRTVFDFVLWEKHRRVDRYWSYLSSIPASRIIWDLLEPLKYVLGLAVVFGAYQTLQESGQLPAAFHSLAFDNDKPWAMSSFALSLLLVFRTTNSYNRFDESRKIWGHILNRARSITNQALTHVPLSNEAGRLQVAKWTLGFLQALRAHLQEDADLRFELERLTPEWTKQEVDMLMNAQHRPCYALSMLSEAVIQLPSLNPLQETQIQEQITSLHDALGGCERILRTPIPLSYTRHTARFLIMWLGTLPFGLWGQYHWASLFVTAMVGFLLLGIDEIGIQIEEPFGILPLDVICKRAQTDVNAMLVDDKAVKEYMAVQLSLPPPADAMTSRRGNGASYDGWLDASASRNGDEWQKARMLEEGLSEAWKKARGY